MPGLIVGALPVAARTSTLMLDDATGTFHPQDDSNERVQYLSGSSGAANGAQNGEYFVVATIGGTRYYFGFNQLPGWAPGDAATNSLTEPVYAPVATQASVQGTSCYNATFSASWCRQGYWWNPDCVVDTHADVVFYFYATEAGAYAPDLVSTATCTRSGYLTKIQCGQRAGQVYTTPPAEQVLFTPTGRCNQSNCDQSTLSSLTAANWPDVPYGLNCATNTACQSQSPSFWTENTLQSIQIQALVGTETKVDSWSLTHTFPATGDSTTPALWLASITHTDQDNQAKGNPASITLPTLLFTGAPLSNRVNLSDGYPPITRQWPWKITTETGETIQVDYSSSACGSAVTSDASQNTMLCYPGHCIPAGHPSSMLEWFNKYIVTTVTETDATGGSANDTISTTYTPVGAPAWHDNTNSRAGRSVHLGPVARLPWHDRLRRYSTRPGDQNPVRLLPRHEWRNLPGGVT